MKLIHIHLESYCCFFSVHLRLNLMKLFLLRIYSFGWRKYFIVWNRSSSRLYSEAEAHKNVVLFSDVSNLLKDESAKSSCRWNSIQNNILLFARSILIPLSASFMNHFQTEGFLKQIEKKPDFAFGSCLKFICFSYSYKSDFYSICYFNCC